MHIKWHQMQCQARHNEINVLGAEREAQAWQYLNSLSDNQDGCYVTDGQVAYTA